MELKESKNRIRLFLRLSLPVNLVLYSIGNCYCYHEPALMFSFYFDRIQLLAVSVKTNLDHDHVLAWRSIAWPGLAWCGERSLGQAWRGMV